MELRALLDLMRGNGAAVQEFSNQCRVLLNNASESLKILGLEHGEEELIALVAAELAKLSPPLQQSGASVLRVTPISPLTPTSSLKEWEIICA